MKYARLTKEQLEELHVEFINFLATQSIHFSKDQIHLFELKDNEMLLIAIKINNEEIDVTTQAGYDWLRDNLLNDEVVFYNASKAYSDDKNLDKFTLIQKGASITKGQLFNYFAKLVED